MGIFKRISTIVRANINELLDKAEDPEKMVEQILRDMKKNYTEVKAQVANAIAEEKKLQRKYEENKKLAANWMAKAELAVDKGEDELAKEALRRKKEYEQVANTFQAQWQAQAETVEKLKATLRELEQKIEEAQLKKESLIARHKSARAQKQMHETLARMDTSSAFEAFERMEEKVEEAEVQAEAAMDLDTDSLEKKFAELEADDDLDEELAALKARRRKDA